MASNEEFNNDDGMGDSNYVRPISGAGSLNLSNGLNLARQMSAAPQMNRSRAGGGRHHNRSSNKPPGYMRERTDDIKKVYSNAVDLTPFENPLMFSHGPP